jgi:hypothetical protein
MAGAAPVGTESENSPQKRIPDRPGFNLAVEKTGTHRARKSAIQLQVKTILNLVQHFVGFVYREVHLRCRQGKQLAGNSAGLPNQLGGGVSICGMVCGVGLGAPPTQRGGIHRSGRDSLGPRQAPSGPATSQAKGEISSGAVEGFRN